MKIAQITMHYFPHTGGQDSYVEYLHNILNEAGHESIVIQPKKSTLTAPLHVVQLLRLPGLKYLFEGANWFFFNFMLLLNKSLFSNYDLIISHYPFHYSVLKNLNKKIIVISHGVDWPKFPKNIFDKYKYKAALSISDNATIVANDRNFFEETFSANVENINEFSTVSKNNWYIPNCVDLKTFKKNNIQRHNIILLPRNIRKSRGIHLAIQGFSIFEKYSRFKGEQYILLIAGGPLRGPYYNYCKRLVRSLSVQHAVRFVGNVDQKTLIRLYGISKITLIPSLNFEGTSLSALESMAVKTPVISTSIGGLADLPTYKTQLHPLDLAHSIIKVLSNYQEISNLQYKSIEDIFNLNKWKKTWKEVINQSFYK